MTARESSKYGISQLNRESGIDDESKKNED